VGLLRGAVSIFLRQHYGLGRLLLRAQSFPSRIYSGMTAMPSEAIAQMHLTTVDCQASMNFGGI